MNNKLSDGQIVRKIKGYQILYFLKLMLPFLAIIVPFLLLIFNSELGVIDDYNKFLIVAVVIFVGTIVFSAMCKNVTTNMNKFIGEHVTKKILEERINIVKYNPTGFIDREYIEKSNIVPNYDVISGSDYVDGTYKGVEILYCDLELKRREKSRESRNNPRSKNTVLNTVFKGPFLWIGLNKKIDGYVKITERKNPRKQRGFLDEVFDSVVGGAANVLGANIKNEVLEVENEAFNNQFFIKTNNEEMAFYILTPHFMENIIRLDNMAQGYTNIRFKNKHVDISINNGEDAFSINKALFTVGQLNKIRDKMRQDLDIILGMVDEIIDKDQLF